MSSNKMLVLTAALMLLLVAVEASSRKGGSSDHKFDISDPAEMRKLLDSPVHAAERVRRPLDGWRHAVGLLSHTGVRVTLEDGSQWLIHKGNNFGKRSQTVVVDADHMSPKWKPIKEKNFEGTKTVSDLVEAGGSRYRLLRDNCHHASRRMMKP